jgi:hypothetical protein
MSGCDRRWELDVYREGRLGAKDARSFERHLKICSECKVRSECDERLRMLAAALPEEPPSELTLRRLRARVLRDVATGVRAPEAVPWSRVALAAGFALAVLGGAGWLAHGRHAPSAVAPTAVVVPVAAPEAEPVPSAAPADALAGTVTATAGARWTQLRRDGLETVTLADGTLGIHVRPQHAGERFLVALPDGELEVRGTTFDVSVAGGATRGVHVDEGHVELRLQGHPDLRLATGESWTAVPAVAAPASLPSSVAEKVASPRTAPSSPGAPAVVASPADDGATAYAGALDLLRTGRGDEAAAAFHAFLLAHPAAPQAEDASFLEAVALARAGRVDAAALAAEHHLASYPGSFHRKEAAVLVARAASQRGDCAHARAVLMPWLGASADADVRAALGSCAQP